MKLPQLLQERVRDRFSPPVTATGSILEPLHAAVDGSACVPMAEVCIKALNQRKIVAIDTGESPEAIVESALLREVLVKMGVTLCGTETPDLFSGPSRGADYRCVVCDEGITIRREGDGNAAPLCAIPLPSPGARYSLPCHLLMLVDTLYCRGALQYPDEFVAFDFETTGRDPRADELVEVGAVKVRGGRESSVFSSFIRPSRPIPREVEKITGINNEMVRNAPGPRDVLSRFLDFCGGLTLVAHNVPFDLAFLRRDVRRFHDREVCNDTEDTLVISRWAYPAVESHRLGHMAAVLGIDTGSWHRAEDDARTAARIYLEFVKGDRAALREVRVKQFLPLAALGIVAQPGPIGDAAAELVRHAMKMMVRHFGLDKKGNVSQAGPAVSGKIIMEMLLSLDDSTRRRGAMALLSRES